MRSFFSQKQFSRLTDNSIFETKVKKLPRRCGKAPLDLPTILQDENTARIVLCAMKECPFQDDPGLVIQWDERGFNDVPTAPGFRNGIRGQTKQVLINHFITNEIIFNSDDIAFIGMCYSFPDIVVDPWIFTDSWISGSDPLPIYSQPNDTGVFRHTLSQLHNVIRFLKEKVDVPQTAEDLKANKIADINTNKQLYDLMIRNEKIIYNNIDRTFQYKPEYAIRSKEDLLNLLKERQEKVGVSRGMPYKELDDCIDLTNAIMVENEGKIMVIRLMKDSSPRLLYWNDQRYNTPMDEEFVAMFNSVKVPDESDLKKSLEDVGLQTVSVLENKVRPELI
ncbi:10336_t:CDS:10 [Diversispora eburnea]|uniref:10336_t:CDS:1 n=1 Tax=Diversispora eburnea TaxID=1213867 RepID=A0A9N8WB47_9GLOM|nr:10336_t:CDS:10 [Diversispora eburnea]